MRSESLVPPGTVPLGYAVHELPDGRAVIALDVRQPDGQVYRLTYCGLTVRQVFGAAAADGFVVTERRPGQRRRRVRAEWAERHRVAAQPTTRARRPLPRRPRARGAGRPTCGAARRGGDSGDTDSSDLSGDPESPSVGGGLRALAHGQFRPTQNPRAAPMTEAPPSQTINRRRCSMTPQDAAEATIRVWTDPDTNQDLVELEALAQLAEGMGLCTDRVELLHGLLRADAEITLEAIEEPGGLRELLCVRMPSGWRELVAGFSGQPL